MPNYKIYYTDRASQDQQELYEYLLEKGGMQTVKKLDAKIEKSLSLIAQRPEMNPSSQQTSIRRCVISKQTSLYYRVNKYNIELLTFFYTRQHPSKKKLK
ncbi:MAG: type II toxin-antitoxin system RelE/ParE family toxin [Salibacteraceae bacterium]